MEIKNARELSKMSLKEKVGFCSGATAWSLKHNNRLQIPEMIMTDGPYGIRMQKSEADPSQLYNCYPATCFPPACTAGSTWNKSLIYKMGVAMGKEATALGTDLILGPGVNIKRNPECGRNFEYYSEDPYLSGKMGAALIKGIQSTGRGACAKHFMGNNQETDRLICKDVIDERALREIYLAAFEMIVKEAKPHSIMASYNETNGVTMTSNVRICRNILRDEWGFDGILMSDWGAVSNRIEAFKAGVDLEMPGSNGFFDKEVINAVKNGDLNEVFIDESTDRILNVIKKVTADKSKKPEFDVKSGDETAYKVAVEGAVLLKNEGVLPIEKTQKVALIGGMAKDFRYQGGGSAHIVPTKVTTILDAFEKGNTEYEYFDGYEGQDTASSLLLNQAVEGARNADKAVVVIGLPETYEAESYDRKSMNIPNAHIELLKAVSEANDNVIVVLLGGAPVIMDWDYMAKGVLNMYLPGQAGGRAAFDLLYGISNPSGRLSETYPLSYDDVPSSELFAKESRMACYDESIYTGYRYYDKAGIPVKYPFGYGLSYTVFDYTDLKVEGDGYDYTVTVTITNIGNMDGSEVAQLYVHDATGMKFKPVRELKGFEKKFLKAGESGMVTFKLDKRSFAYYDTDKKDWVVTKGSYDIRIGSTSRDIMFTHRLELDGEDFDNDKYPKWYNAPAEKPVRAQFEQLIGQSIEPYRCPVPGEFTVMTPVIDMINTKAGKKYADTLTNGAKKLFGEDEKNTAYLMEIEQLMTAPLQALYLQGHISGSFSTIKNVVKKANKEIL